MPWEQVRDCKVIYHYTGAFTLVKEVSNVIEPVFISQWGTMWTAMKKEKRKRQKSKQISFPLFNDRTPLLDYGGDIMIHKPPDPMQLELDEDEDDAVFDFLYDHQPLKDTNMGKGSDYRNWELPQSIMANLYRLSGQLLNDLMSKEYDTKNEGLRISNFSFDAVTNSMASYKSDKHKKYPKELHTNKEFNFRKISNSFELFLNNEFDLRCAPYPFNQLSGNTKKHIRFNW
jgi:hypothetical protein